MPYESTIYSHMTEEMVRQFKEGFKQALFMAVKRFQPDLILCHHLYLLTAMVLGLSTVHCSRPQPWIGFASNPKESAGI